LFLLWCMATRRWPSLIPRCSLTSGKWITSEYVHLTCVSQTSTPSAWCFHVVDCCLVVLLFEQGYPFSGWRGLCFWVDSYLFCVLFQSTLVETSMEQHSATFLQHYVNGPKSTGDSLGRPKKSWVPLTKRHANRICLHVKLNSTNSTNYRDLLTKLPNASLADDFLSWVLRDHYLDTVALQRMY